MNDDPLLELADIYFTDVHGVTFAAMLAPISAQLPAGDLLAGAAFYQNVGEARRQDDASLPMGPWAHELKRADWHVVAKMTAQGIAERSKDLQLAAWLLEAEIHRHGYAGVAPCLRLIQGLLDQYWDELYPRLDDGDSEHRANIIRWIDQRLRAPLSLIPLTACGWERGEFDWSDWERAGRNEHLRLVHGGDGGAEGIGRNDVLAALAATPTELHHQTYAELEMAGQAVAALDACLDRRFGADAPGLAGLGGLLGDIAALIEQELSKRGLGSAPEPGVDSTEPSPLAAQPAAIPVDNTPDARAQAYARLAELAEFLLRADPHSPVPYLVRRAVEWGQLDTRELYEQLFIRQQGQINVFELVGADMASAQPDRD